MILVINKETGQEVYRYAADAVVEWPAYPLIDYDHVVVEDPVVETVAPKRIWEPPFEFMRRFTNEERVQIRLAAKADIVIEDFLDLCKTAPSIHSDDPDLQAAMQYFVALGLITEERRETILNG